MEFVLLGSVEGWAGEQRVDLGTVRQRCVLAALLASPGRPVPLDVLVDRVWGADPPVSVRNTLYSYIARLRRILTEHGLALDKRTGGYQVAAPVHAVDLWQWDELLQQARTAVADGERMEFLDRALDLWQGRPLDNLDGQWVVQVRDKIEQQYIAALAEWAELTIDDGRAADVASRLAGPVAAWPSVEPLVAARMRALRAMGRTAEALECFARIRQHTIDELGVEPGQALRELHMSLLQEPDERAVPKPAQLPAAVADFIGRADAIEQLNSLVSADALVITALAGTAGVGKTALAVQWAHQIAPEFPDGQLYLNLNGYSSAPRVEPARALDLMLQSLGVPGDQIPASVESRAAMYRSLLAGKRMLVVLDNVDSAGQVRPLLPGQPGCLVLVTSRDRLGGLVAMDGARRIDVDLLSHDESFALMRRLLGDRVDASRQATDRLVSLCGRLPLALRIAAANLGSQPIASYVQTLEQNRLGQLVIDGDSRAAVSTQLDYSYEHLGVAEREMFRLLACIPGADVSAEGAAALLGSTVEAARPLLARLVDAHLVVQERSRFSCHDLLSAYAGSLVDDSETSAALHRLFGWCLDMAMAAMEQIDPNRRKLLPPPVDIEFPSYDSAMTWLETERSTLVAVTVAAAARGWHSYAWELPHALWSYFYIRGHLNDWHTTHELALTAARALDDPMALAETLNNLGTAHRRAGRLPQALDHHLDALGIYRQIGDEVGAATALSNTGIVHQRLGQYPQALDHFGQVLVLQERLGDVRQQARTLGNLGVIYEELGRYPEALTHYGQALAKFELIRDRLGEAIALANIGIVHQRLGQYPQALDHQRKAFALHQSLGDRQGEAAVLANLGYTYCQLGRTTEAFSHQQQALTLARQIGDTDLESEIHNDLGETHAAAGAHMAALTEYRHALTMSIDTGNRHQEGRAHRGIAQAQHAVGEHYTARKHWGAALRLYTELGVAEVARLGAELAALDPDCQPTGDRVR
ncbi:tetratricopeptide repeat protein [Actinocrispum sp. NPDC049592]|uniref:AfsR/SARP family transcriptional regulator n=1 Tax=Actinocrispum sp. NPDC049592 TaxID=3154835 RepID=UPI003445D977